MAITFNVRHLEKKNLQLNGQISPAELEIEQVDELIHPRQSLTYALEVQRLESNILVQGSLTMPLQCECARCLKSFVYQVELPHWSCLLPLEGEDAVKVVNDLVDLTPYLREDMLLSFPQHPLCEPGCGGMKLPPQTEPEKVSGVWPDDRRGVSVDRIG
jgi:uncharacterized protein